jgi:hypothetical protein
VPPRPSLSPRPPRAVAVVAAVLEAAGMSMRNHESSIMGLDLLPILPRALPSGSAVAVVGQRARAQQHCQNGQFFLLIQCL